MSSARGLALYYLWALGEQSLSHIPGGKGLYRAVGLLVNRTTKGADRGNFASALKVAKKARTLAPPGSSVVDVGTGWYHCLAFLLHLTGEYRVYLFDVEDKARLRYIRNYLGALLANVETVSTQLDLQVDEASQKLRDLLQLQSREDIYAACGFVPVITRETSTPFVEQGSIDLMLSTCVLNHIAPAILVPELNALRSMLKRGGHMYHTLGHVDHWTYHSPSVNMFNYFQYSDAYYRRVFETDLEYQNRMVRPEWIRVFIACGLSVVEWESQVTVESRRCLSNLPRLDARFAQVPTDDLAAAKSFVLLRRER